MSEGIYYQQGYMGITSDEGWLESKVGGGTTDEGYLDRLIDEAFVMVDRLHFLLDKVTERILAKQSEQDWGLNKSTELV